MYRIMALAIILPLIVMSCSNNSLQEKKTESSNPWIALSQSKDSSGTDQRSLLLKAYKKSLQYFKSDAFKKEMINMVNSMDPKIAEWKKDSLNDSQMMEKAFRELEDIFVKHDMANARSFGFYDYNRFCEVGKNLMGDPEYNALYDEIVKMKNQVQGEYEEMITPRIASSPAPGKK